MSVIIAILLLAVAFLLYREAGRQYDEYWRIEVRGEDAPEVWWRCCACFLCGAGVIACVMAAIAVIIHSLF